MSSVTCLRAEVFWEREARRALFCLEISMLVLSRVAEEGSVASLLFAGVCVRHGGRLVVNGFNLVFVTGYRGSNKSRRK